MHQRPKPRGTTDIDCAIFPSLRGDSSTTARFRTCYRICIYRRYRPFCSPILAIASYAARGMVGRLAFGVLTCYLATTAIDHARRPPESRRTQPTDLIRSVLWLAVMTTANFPGEYIQ